MSDLEETRHLGCRTDVEERQDASWNDSVA